MKKSIFITISLVVLAFSATAQETIEKMYSEYSDFSMIRPWSTKSWLVYSHPGYCDFNRVYDLTNNVDILRLPEDFISVSDYKVDTDMVYFCGLMSDNVPVMGYFEKGTFPNSTVNYICLPTLVKLQKLEVISDNKGTQVIMIGNTGQSDIVVDAIKSGGVWDVYFINPYIPDGNINTLDDVAIIDNYVVFTAQYIEIIGNNDNAPTRGFHKLLYFSKPATTLIPLSASTVNYLDIPYFTITKFGIKKCENDAFVIAGTSSLGEPYISGYNGYTHEGTVIIHKYNSRIKSISYSPDSKTTEIVIDSLDVLTNGSRIYTLHPGMTTIPSTAYGHRFPGHRLKSLWYQSNNPLHYICVGDSIGNTNDLFLYRYFYNYPIQCSELISAEISIEKIVKEKQSADFYSDNNKYKVQSKPPIIKGTSIIKRCDSQFKNQ